MERAAANDSPRILENDKVADVFTQFGQRTRQKRAVAGVSGDELMNLVGVGQDRFTRAHVVPRATSQLSFWWRQSPAAPELEPFHRAHCGGPAPTPGSAKRRNPAQTSD